MKSKEDIFKETKKMISELIDNNRFIFLDREGLGFLNDCCYGLGFHCYDTDEFKRLDEFIVHKFSFKRNKDLEIGCHELLSLMTSDTRLFWKKLSLANSTECIYDRIPILKNIDPSVIQHLI